MHSHLHLGTSSFSHESWVGPFYPPGTKPSDFLSVYAQRFDTVEIDATFYRIPSAAQVRNWAAKTPADFRIAAKVPQVITHEKLLVDCAGELTAFLKAMDELGDRMGPLLFQFPYFKRDVFPSLEKFLERLRPFLAQLPGGRPYALEVRNRAWVSAPLLDLLRGHGIAYAIIDHPWMPTIEELLKIQDPLTANFAYVRWLGDRKGIEERTKTWEKLIVDRTAEMERWVPALARLLTRDIHVYGYFNNHYAGHAPGSIQLLREIWRKKLGVEEMP